MCWQKQAGQIIYGDDKNMTQVELAGKIGNDLLNIVKVYLKGQLTMDELSMILGRDRTEEVKKYMVSAAGEA